MAWIREAQIIKWGSAIALVLITLAAHGNELPVLLTPYRAWVELGGFLGGLVQMLFIELGRREWTPLEREMKRLERDEHEAATR